MIKVSVVIPVYNAEKFLKDCLTSVVRQSLCDIEIICVNDGSQDNSLKIIEEFAFSDNRVKILNHEHCGAAVSRNNGFETAEGKYVIFLDSDDVFDLTMLEKMYSLAEEQNSDIVVSNSCVLDQKSGEKKSQKNHLRKELLPAEMSFTPTDINKYIFNFTVGWAWDKLFRRDFISESNLQFQDLPSTNDVYFVYSALALAKKISVIDNELVTHRINIPNQISSKRDNNPLCFVEAINAVKNRLDNAGLYSAFEQSFLNWVMEHTVWQYRTTKNEIIREKLIKEIYPNFELFTKGSDYYYDKIAYQRMFQLSGWSNIPFKPYVSIIIPVYNVQNYLEECLDSVTRQNLKEIEIICVDDGSTDKSPEILKQYAEFDKRIRIITQKNSGLGKAYNVGMDCASGEYIGFVEPDDYIKPEMFEHLYRTAKASNTDFVKSDFISFEVSPDGTMTETYRQINSDGTYYGKVIDMNESVMPFRFIMNIWTGIYKTDFIRKNNIRFNETAGASYQDNGFWFQSFACADTGYFLKEGMYMHRADNPNSSVKSKDKIYAMKSEYDFIKAFLESHPKIKDKYMGIHHYKRFHNYMFTLNRIDECFKKEFLQTFADDFKTAYKNNEIDETIFRQDELERLKRIIYDPKEFIN